MKKTVVIVDDSEYLAEMLGEFFSKTLGFEVVGTGFNGAQALTLYKQHRPDLITLDLTMPIKTGREVITELLTEFPQASILVISSQIGHAVVECLKLGAKGYVEKPLRLDDSEFVRDFKQAVEECLADKNS